MIIIIVIVIITLIVTMMTKPGRAEQDKASGAHKHFSSSPLLGFTAVDPAHCGYKRVPSGNKLLKQTTARQSQYSAVCVQKLQPEHGCRLGAVNVSKP